MHEFSISIEILNGTFFSDSAKYLGIVESQIIFLLYILEKNVLNKT